MVSRRIWDHPAFAASEFSEREAFLWLVSEASWKPRTVRAGRAVVNLERGQLCASIRFMATAWTWSKSRVDRFLKRLEKQDMVRAESGTGQLIITLCNYDEYQGKRDTGGTRAGHERDTSGTNYNKDEIRDNNTDTNVSVARAKRRRSPSSPLPDDWVPDMAKAQSLMAELDLTRDEMNYCYQQMKGHAHATDRRLANWDQGFGNWVRKAVKDGDVGPGSRSRRNHVNGSAFDF